MAIDASLNHQVCTGTDRQVAEALKNALNTTNTETLTEHLFSAASISAIPPGVLGIYISLSHEPSVLAAALKQTFSISVRRKAIKRLAVFLRSQDEFNPTWTALGGATGIANLMRQFSVQHVDLLCRALGSTSSANSSAAFSNEREKAMSELLGLLVDLEPAKEKQGPIETYLVMRDQRPLRSAYGHLAPACTSETQQQWRRLLDPSAPEPKPYYPRYLERGQEGKLATVFVGQDSKLECMQWLLDLDDLQPFYHSALERIAECDIKDLKIKPDSFYKDLLVSTAVHMTRLNPPRGARDKIWALFVACFRRWPALTKCLTSNQFSTDPSLITLAIRWWNFVPTEERHRKASIVLQHLLELIPPDQMPKISAIPGWLYGSREHRYDLFRRLLQLPGRYGVNVDFPTPEDIAKLSALDEDVPYALFELLPGDKAAAFLALLAEARPDKTFLSLSPTGRWLGHSILSHPSGQGYPQRADFEILHCLLHTLAGPGGTQRAGSDVMVKAGPLVESRIARSNRGREPSDRAFWAKSALFLSIASGSLELYANTLRWSRRFIRDYHTLAELNTESTLLTKEGVSLLCGVPCQGHFPVVPVDNVWDDILAGNRILVYLVETAVAGLQEPSFTAQTWRNVPTVVSMVVQKRLQRVNRFQTHYGLTDSEVFDNVWKPTLDMLLEVERLSTQEGNERLSFVDRGGMINHLVMPELGNHGWRFLDDLARARDLLWKTERLKRHPDVLSLGTPWPMGLPVQDLCPRFSEDVAVKLPYVLERAKGVLFTDPTTLLSAITTDKSVLRAIGGFVDDFRGAFRLYIKGEDRREGSKRERIERVWKHVMEKLSVGMSAEEARGFWKRVVFFDVSADIIPESTQSKQSDPSFPEADSNIPSEWYPGPVEGVPATERKLPGPLTCLEVMLSPPDTHGSVFSRPQLPSKHRVSVAGQPGFWQRASQASWKSGEVKDAYIAAAMLCINSRLGSDAGFLMQPFPTPESPRFAPVYLADEFLEMSGESSVLHNCVSILEQQRERVPPVLLLRLANSAFGRLIDLQAPEGTLHIILRLVKLVSRSEMPWSACAVIRTMLMEGKGKSSWHRHLFNSGYFDILPAAEARRFLESMCDHMVDRLDASAKARMESQGQQQPKGDDKQVPLIKVTTVKMLAQVINSAKFIDKPTACSILAKVIAHSNHVDIQMAAIESLVQIFISSADDDATRMRIMDVLAENVIRIASSLDERWPTEDRDWEAAESEGKVLEVCGTYPYDRPLLQLLLTTTAMSREWRQRWADKILFPVLDGLVENGRRWIRLFLKIHDLSCPEEEIPLVPIVPKILDVLIEDWPEYVDARLFEMARALAMANVSPPPGLSAVTSKVKKTKALSAALDGMYWNSLFGRDTLTSAFTLSINTCARLLNKPSSVWETFREDGITVPLVQEFLSSVAGVFIDQSRVDFLENLVGYINQIPSHGFSRAECRKAWKANGFPVVQQIVRRIESLRTPAWNRDPRRRPRQLPNTFKMRLQLLDFPSTTANPSGDPAPNSEIEVFAAQIKQLIGELLSRGTPYQNDWHLVQAAATRSPVSSSDMLRISLALAEDIIPGMAAQDERQPAMAEYMRLALARQLIEQSEDPKDSDVVLRVRKMLVVDWQGSYDEHTRERARELVQKLKNKKAKGFWKRYRKEFETRIEAEEVDGDGLGEDDEEMGDE